MPDKAWKAFERQVAKIFNTTRNALSGINSKTTHSDTLHEKLFLECKYRKSLAIFTLFDSTKELATKENKLPVICQKQKGCNGFLITIHSDDLQDFIKTCQP